MKIGERMACVETRLRTIEKLIYVVLTVLGARIGIDYFPVVTAVIG